jgi:carbamoyltransferase
MRILGLSAFHRDAAAALVVDGEIVAAAQEERFTRLSLDPAFPKRALRWCLAQAEVAGPALDHVVFYEKPLRKFERVMARSLRAFPRSGRTFSKSLFLWLGERLWLRDRIADELGIAPEKVLFVEQARALLAQAFHASPFEEAALLLLDDVGEWTATAFGRGRGHEVELLLEQRHPHSLGLFASAMTQYLGFVPGEEEHKLEALAIRGDARRKAELEALFHPEGELFELDQELFRFDDGAALLFTPELEKKLGPARRTGDPLCFEGSERGHADLAASVQQVLEEKALLLARALAKRVDSPRLCVGGLLAGNRALVARLAAEGPFREVFVALAAGKAGGAAGAALHAHAILTGQPPRRAASAMAACAKGEIPDAALAEEGARELGTPEQCRAELVARLGQGACAGWVAGPMEFAERGHAHRIALARPSPDEKRPRLLAALRHDEPFLPCRVVLPSEAAPEFFEPFAGGTWLARGARVRAVAKERLRALVPAAVGDDGRAWPQLVSVEDDPVLHAVLREIGAASGAPILWLADLALRGSPLVRSESEAVEAFRRSDLDVLFAGSRLYERS